jgi:hypothetical protein
MARRRIAAVETNGTTASGGVSASFARQAIPRTWEQGRSFNPAKL